MARQKPNTLRVDNREWKKMRKRLRQGNADVVANVGFFPESRYGPENDNLPVAQVAQWSEEGTRGGQNNGSGIPARPFMRYTIQSLRKDKEVSKILTREFNLFLEGRSTRTQMARSLGEHAKREMKANMVKWSAPENSPFTVQQKGFNNPLIETGQMYDSVDVKMGKRAKK